MINKRELVEELVRVRYEFETLGELLTDIRAPFEVGKVYQRVQDRLEDIQRQIQKE